MRLDSSTSPAEKRRWQILRLDYSGPNNGIVAAGEEIVEADDATGHVVSLQRTYDANGMLVVDEIGKPIMGQVATEYGLHAIRLVRRR